MLAHPVVQYLILVAPIFELSPFVFSSNQFLHQLKDTFLGTTSVQRWAASKRSVPAVRTAASISRFAES